MTGPAISGYASFETVAQLDSSNLRKLLLSGDAQDRVWAAWALALRVGEQASGALRHAARASPAAGVRRHLIVALAGLGEREILRAFAAEDPSELVRATACQYVMRTRGDQDRETAEFLLNRLLSEPSATVRARILQEATTTVPPASKEQLVGLASDDSVEVRRLALVLIKRRYDPEEAFTCRLAERLRLEPEHELQAELAHFALEGGLLDLVLSAAVKAQPSVRLLLLDLLLERNEILTWPAAQALATLEEPAVDRTLLKLLGPEGLRDGFAWLARRMAACVRDKAEEPDWLFFQEALAVLPGLLPSLPASQLTADCRRDLGVLLVDLNEEIAELSEADREEWDDLYGGALEETLEFYETLVQMIGAALRRA
ncbi:MAG: HEAT repeat domain-containing protein [Rhodospirillales bacterium]|nr:HEAT repeat domain-containing protein [Rhodospirillales bacterium]